MQSVGPTYTPMIGLSEMPPGVPSMHAAAACQVIVLTRRSNEASEPVGPFGPEPQVKRSILRRQLGYRLNHDMWPPLHTHV